MHTKLKSKCALRLTLYATNKDQLIAIYSVRLSL